MARVPRSYVRTRIEGRNSRRRRACTHAVMAEWHRAAVCRLRRIRGHVMMVAPDSAAAAEKKRPLGILGAGESESGPQYADQLTFRAPPAEVRAVDTRSSFSMHEYRTKGFTGPIRLFTPEQAAAVASAFLGDSVRATNKEVLSGQKSAELLSRQPPTTHPATWADTLPLAKDPKLLDLVEKVLGPDLVLWATVFWHKPPGSDGYIPWQCVPLPAPCCSSSVHVLSVYPPRWHMRLYFYPQSGWRLLAARTPGQPDHMDRPDANQR